MTMTTLNWSKFNAIIVTRHSCKELYDKNRIILDKLPYKKEALENPPAGDYIWHCITRYEGQYDYVINIDDDAFFMDFSGLYDVLEDVENGGYDFAGMPDGMTWTPRDIFNPASMNPFFNVFHIPRILKKLRAAPGGPNVKFSPGLIEGIAPTLKEVGFHPEALAEGVTWENLTKHAFPTNYEPYYPVFFALLNAGCKPLMLYGRSWNGDRCPEHQRVGLVSPRDWFTTVLYTANKKPFIYHTWLARDYLEPKNTYTPRDNYDRINRAFDLALLALKELGA